MNTVQAKDYFSDFTQKLTALYDIDEAKAITQVVCSELLLIKPHQLQILNKTLTEPEIQSFNTILDKLLTGEPLQHVLGYSWFCGLKFMVNKNVLIPRPETEELVELILKQYKNNAAQHLVFIDLGTGSGCIPISIKKNIPEATVIGIDISPEALDVAKQNADINKVDVLFAKVDMLNLPQLQTFIQQQLPQEECLLVLISNPPYIKNSESALMHNNVLQFEPHTALFVPDEDGLKYYKGIADLTNVLGKAIHSLWLEINPLLADETKQVFTNLADMDGINLLNDLQGKKRFCIILL
jgi:release factor glutamine methyltransferase